MPLIFALGAVFAFGMASAFKYVADDFPQNRGVVWVSLSLIHLSEIRRTPSDGAVQGVNWANAHAT